MRKTDLQVPKTHLNQKEKHNPFPIFFSPFYFILLIILLIGGNITAQVIIKEKVEIDPQNQILPNNPTQNYNFRVEVDWDAEEVQANNHFWNANLQVNTALINSCDEFVTETGFTYGWPTGSNSLELQANAYRYKILVTISGFYDSYQFVDLIVRTYLNNNLRHTFTQRVNSGIWTYFSETRTAEFNEWLYLVESFHFSIDDELIGYGCFYTVNLRTNTEGSCGSSVVASLEYDPINLTIIKGSEYLTFYDNRTNEDAGSSIQVMPQYFNKIDLRYQNPLRDTVSKIGVVQLESNGIVETDSIEILHAPDDLNVSVYPEEITTGEEAELYLFIDYCPPPGTKINIEIIKGQKYGGLIDPYTNEKSKIITNLDHMFGYAWVDYVADSLSAVATDSVIFRVTTTDPEIVPKEAILIIKPPPLKVIIDPPQLTAGDTVDIIIKKRNPDGSLEDFPPNQEFEIAKLEGCLFGDVLIGDSLNYYFADAKQPVKFVVADSLVSDSGVVKLRVGLVENYESINQKYNGKKLRAGKYIEKGKEEWRLKLEKLFAEKRNETLKLMPNGLSSSCYIGYFITETCWQGDVPIGKPKLEIIYPTPITTAWITPEPNPKMPVVNCKAILDNYCKRGKVSFNWEYWVRYTLFRHEFGTNDTICRRTGIVKITGSTEYEIGDPDGSGCSPESDWSVSFDYNPFLTNVEFKGKHKSQEGGCDAIIDHWYEGDKIFIGGDAYVKVTAKDIFGKVIAISESSGGKILGTNPSLEGFVNYVTQLDFQALVRKETATRRGRQPNHFNFENTTKYYRNKDGSLKFILEGWKYNPRGYPDFGPPNGYGFAQIDNAPPPTEMDLWNWQTNLNSGQRKHNNNKTSVRGDIRRIGAIYDEKVVLMNAFQMYLKSDIEADVARKISKKWLDLEKIIRAIVLILVFIIFRQSLTLFSGI
ncbi:MAG: hypothetical protein Q8N03_17245, partial [Ignavibacteria bacterium]|nr:hypothetical protein [Ignavibacteria bacterium]